jgi:acetoacetyl-CoA synthetase
MTQPTWTPPAERFAESAYTRWLGWLARERGLHFRDYREVWRWSTTEIEQFWESLLHFFELRATPHRAVLEDRTMTGARWFPGAHLNYAEHALRHSRDAAVPQRIRDEPAIIWQSELHPLTTVTWSELEADVASVAASLTSMGVQRGDRVCALLPNGPHAVIAFLACAGIGAVWSCCSPDFGAEGVTLRFGQLAPKVLIGVDGYSYGGRRIDTRGTVAALRDALPSVQHTVLVPWLDADAALPGTVPWQELLGRDVALHFEPVPFEHPLWILFSSGTTGAPKAIVHGHGGIVLEHLKSIALQNDMRPGDRFLWFTTTGWMMWNVLMGGLLAGCTIVLYDGSPAHPDLGVLWRLAEQARVTRFGTSAAYLTTCMNAGLEPGARFDLSALRAVGATGSPLPPEAFAWVYDHVKRDVWLAPSSGGTDVASAFLCGCPTLPVYSGELQGAALGARVEVFDDEGRSVIGAAGELVITAPMPSMPLYFWNDPDGERYRETYFDAFPGVWRHGDRVMVNERGGAVIFGRSDATLNRLGVRMGTAEIYRAVEAVPGVADSLVIGVELPGGGYWMPLFVVTEPGRELDDALRAAIRERIRSSASPRHVPDEVIRIDAVPRTLNGKKVEVPVKRILQGVPAGDAVMAGSLANPESLWFFERLARERAAL